MRLNHKFDFRASYDSLLSKIEMPDDCISGLDLTFLANGGYEKNKDRVSSILSFIHEVSHYIQAWTTTNGIMTHLLLANIRGQFVHIFNRSKYKLPIYNYFNSLRSKGLNMSLDEMTFMNLYLRASMMDMSFHWLKGGVSPTVDRFKKGNRKFKRDEVFIIIEACLTSEDLDATMEYTPRKIGLFNPNQYTKHAKQVRAKDFIPVGTRHLEEGFATAVQFDHFFNIEFDVASCTFENLVNNPAPMYVDYNLAFNMLYRISNKYWIERKSGNLFLMHIMILIDIAMMYSDLLFIDAKSVEDGTNHYLFSRQQIHPGVTYFTALKHFSDCEPLKNSNEDILRLYSELCEKMGIPSLNVMIESLISILNSLIGYKERKKAKYQEVKYYEKAIELLRLKKEDPILFFSGLCRPCGFNSIYDKVSDTLPIFSPKGSLGSNWLFTIESEIHTEVLRQFLYYDVIECPIYNVLERYKHKFDYDFNSVKKCVCDGTPSSCKNFESGCTHAPLISLIYKNATQSR